MRTLGVIVTVLVAISVPASQCALAHTWIIQPDGSGDAPTIQAGIDSAAAGDTLLIAAGSYLDTTRVMIDGQPTIVNAHVYKTVTMLGAGAPTDAVIDGADSDICVYVPDGTNGVALRRLWTKRRSEGYICFVPSPRVEASVNSTGMRIDGANARVANCGFEEFTIGLDVHGQGITIESTSFRDIGICVDAEDAPNSLVQACTFVDFGVGVSCLRESVVVDSCVFGVSSPSEQSCAGVEAYGCNATVRNSSFESLVQNGVFASGATCIVEGNKFRAIHSAVYLFSASNDCVVRRNVFRETTIGVETLGASSATIERNTFDGQTSALSLQSMSGSILGNIVVNSQTGVNCVAGVAVVVECNNLFDTDNPYAGECPDLTGVDGNFSADPEFCGIPGSGLYTLQSDSPCAEGNHPDGYSCGVIGALDVACGQVKVERQSLGQIKALFREGNEK